MNVSVFGLGYVGCVTAACLAREGHQVVGVDVNRAKVDMINEGRSPIVEDGLQAILECVVRGSQAGRLRATDDASRAVTESDASIICVGTPSESNGSLRLDFVRRCAREIGLGLR